MHWPSISADNTEAGHLLILLEKDVSNIVEAHWTSIARELILPNMDEIATRVGRPLRVVDVDKGKIPFFGPFDLDAWEVNIPVKLLENPNSCVSIDEIVHRTIQIFERNTIGRVIKVKLCFG